VYRQILCGMGGSGREPMRMLLECFAGGEEGGSHTCIAGSPVKV
jgi:hypothetical protein